MWWKYLFGQTHHAIIEITIVQCIICHQNSSHVATKKQLRTLSRCWRLVGARLCCCVRSVMDCGAAKWLLCGEEYSADLMSFLIGLCGEISQKKRQQLNWSMSIFKLHSRSIMVCLFIHCSLTSRVIYKVKGITGFGKYLTFSPILTQI